MQERDTIGAAREQALREQQRIWRKGQLSTRKHVALGASTTPMPRYARSTVKTLALVCLGLGLAGCGSNAAESRTIAIVTGHENDTFTQSPAVETVRITVTTVSGTSFTAETTPGGSFDLGELPSNEALVIEVVGVTADGIAVVRGRSLSGILLGAYNASVPVFVQRVRTFARPPGSLTRAHVRAPATVIGEQYLATTGGENAFDVAGEADPNLGDFYDLGTWDGRVTTDTFPLRARSLVGRYNGLFLIADDGATWLSSDGTLQTAPLPSALASYGDVAGGTVVEAPSGTTYVVGAGRQDTPSKAVLAMAADGTLSAYSLLEARQGAAVTWAEGLGLVIAGGSATATGVEVLEEGQTAFVAKDFPPDPTVNAAAVLAVDGRFALVGGTMPDGSPAKTRSFVPSCSASCEVTEIAGASIPFGMHRTKAYSLGANQVLVVGEETAMSAQTRVLEIDLDAGKQTEHALREPRSGATAVPAPNGTLAILGGVLESGAPARNVEMFFP